MKNLLPLRYRSFAVPVGSIAFMIFLTLFGGYFLYGQIAKVRGDIKKVENQNQALEGRLTVLRQSGSALRTYSDNSVFALPDKNPSLVVSTNLRALAEQEGLDIDELSTRQGSSREEDDVQSINIKMSVTGDQEQIFVFADDISRISPIINVREATILEERGTYIADFDLLAYWSPLPTELPRIDQPLLELSNDELSVIQKINALERSEILRLPPPQTDVELRADPFNF